MKNTNCKPDDVSYPVVTVNILLLQLTCLLTKQELSYSLLYVASQAATP